MSLVSRAATIQNAWNVLKPMVERDARPGAASAGCFTAHFFTLMDTPLDNTQIAIVAALIDMAYTMGYATREEGR